MEPSSADSVVRHAMQQGRASRRRLLPPDLPSDLVLRHCSSLPGAHAVVEDVLLAAIINLPLPPLRPSRLRLSLNPGAELAGIRGPAAPPASPRPVQLAGP